MTLLSQVFSMTDRSFLIFTLYSFWCLYISISYISTLSVMSSLLVAYWRYYTLSRRSPSRWCSCSFMPKGVKLRTMVESLFEATDNGREPLPMGAQWARCSTFPLLLDYYLMFLIVQIVTRSEEWSRQQPQTSQLECSRLLGLRSSAATGLNGWALKEPFC